MFRNVYWHHGVRAATALYKRIVEVAVGEELVTADELLGPTDEELLHLMGRRATEVDTPGARSVRERWLPALRNRHLPKRALELTAADLEEVTLPSWMGADSPSKRELEERLAEELKLPAGEVVVDYPAKAAMFQLNILLERRNGDVARVGTSGLPGVIDLPRVTEELYRTARVLRVFTFERRNLDRGFFLESLAR
jgi:hypothetical protein